MIRKKCLLEKLIDKYLYVFSKIIFLNYSYFIIFVLFNSHLLADEMIVNASNYNGKNLIKKFQMMQTGYTTTNKYIMHFGRLRDIKCTNIRIDHIWDLHYILTGTYPNFKYNWYHLDQKIEQIEKESTIPYICLSYTPSVLGPWNHPPNNMIAWKEICKQLALHLKNKGYGIKYYEVWNEPDLDIFWKGTQQQYFELYRYAVEGILEADPTAKVGGPSIAHNVYWIRPFLEFCTTNNLPVNFISFHDFNWDVNSTINRLQMIQDAIDEFPNFSNIEIHLGEWNSCVDCNYIYDGDRAKGAAWLLHAMKKLLEYENLTIVQRAQYIDIGGTYIWGNLGAVEEDGGPPKAVYNAYKIYAMVPEQRISLQTIGRTVDGMASCTSDTIAVIFWNYSNNYNNLQLTINNINLTDIKYEKFIIDQNHSSYWDNPTSEELEKVESKDIVDIVSYYEEIEMKPYSSYLILLYGHDSSLKVENLNENTQHYSNLDIFPNPSNSFVNIKYNLFKSGNVSLKIYNVLGEEIVILLNEYQAIGSYENIWDTQNISSGLYVVKLETSYSNNFKKVLIQK